MSLAAEDLAPATAPDAGTLHCIICQAPIPEARARRQTATCSEKCKNRLDTIRAHQRAAKRCPACLVPSTPAEREAFRAWRADRGDIKSSTLVKRDTSLPAKQEMRAAMLQAITALKSERDRLAEALQTPKHVDVGQFHVVLETGDDGWIVAQCPALPGCFSQGKTEQEALANIQEAITAWLQARDQKQAEASESPQDAPAGQDEGKPTPAPKNVLETKAGGIEGLTVAFTKKQRAQAEKKLERLTTLISLCEQTVALKREPL